VKGSVELPNAEGFKPVNISGSKANDVDIVLPDFNLSGYGWCFYYRTVPE